MRSSFVLSVNMALRRAQQSLCSAESLRISQQTRICSYRTLAQHSSFAMPQKRSEKCLCHGQIADSAEMLRNFATQSFANPPPPSQREGTHDTASNYKIPNTKLQENPESLLELFQTGSTVEMLDPEMEAKIERLLKLCLRRDAESVRSALETFSSLAYLDIRYWDRLLFALKRSGDKTYIVHFLRRHWRDRGGKISSKLWFRILLLYINDTQDLLQLLHRLSSNGSIVVPKYVYQLLLLQTRRFHGLEATEQLLIDLISLELGVNAKVWDFLITEHLKDNNIDKAKNVIDAMVAMGIGINATSCKPIMEYLSKADSNSPAAAKMRACLDNIDQSDPENLDHCRDLYRRRLLTEGKVDEPASYLDEQIKRGITIGSSVSSTKIQTDGEICDLEKVEKFPSIHYQNRNERSKEAQHEPKLTNLEVLDTRSLSSLMEAEISRNQFDDGHRILKQIIARGPLVPRVSGGMMIAFLGDRKNARNAEMARQAFKAFMSLRAGGCLPNQSSCYRVLRALAAHDAVIEYRKMMEAMRHSGYKLNNLIYSALLSSYCRQGDWARAIHVLTQEMRNDGIAPTERMFNILLYGIFKSKNHGLIASFGKLLRDSNDENSLRRLKVSDVHAFLLWMLAESRTPQDLAESLSWYKAAISMSRPDHSSDASSESQPHTLCSKELTRYIRSHITVWRKEEATSKLAQRLEKNFEKWKILADRNLQMIRQLQPGSTTLIASNG